MLSLRKERPDFFVAAIHSQNPGPGGTNIWRGGAEALDIIVHYQGGFSGPITINASNLPQGVHAAGTTLGNTNSGVFVLWADENAPVATSSIQLLATAQLPNGETVVREVRAYARVWQQGDGSSRAVREQVISVSNQAPFALRFSDQKVSVVSGQKVQAKLKLTRLWADCKDPVNILPLSWPGNIKTSNAQIAGDATELLLTIEVEANTRPGDYKLSVLGQAQVLFTKMADASDKKNTLVSLPSQPFTLVVSPPPK